MNDFMNQYINEIDAYHNDYLTYIDPSTIDNKIETIQKEPSSLLEWIINDANFRELGNKIR